MSALEKIYYLLPVCLQNCCVTLYGLYWKQLRFGGQYEKHLKDYLQRSSYSKEDWEKYQNDKLKKVLSIAVDHIPYYQKNYSSEEKSAARQGDLHSLPVTEKDPIRTNPKDFLRNDKNAQQKIIFHTSGSTGTPIKTYWTPDELRQSIAVREARSALWAGVSFKRPRATFSGRLILSTHQKNPPFYRYNAVEKQVYFSAFHLSPKTVNDYAEALRKHQIEWLTGYAFSCYMLAKLALEKNITLRPLKAVITTSEKLTEDMRIIIEKGFQCKVYEEYSNVENSVFVSECSRSCLHISPDVGILEILRDDGNPCDEGEEGHIVATCLMHEYQIFIRYQLGDLGIMSKKKCSCGMNTPILEKISGRAEEAVTTREGKKIIRFHGIFTDQANVQKGQIIQESIDCIRVKVVPTTYFTDEDTKDIQLRVRQRLGATVRVKVEKVDDIPLTKSGKFQAVISKIK